MTVPPVDQRRQRADLVQVRCPRALVGGDAGHRLDLAGEPALGPGGDGPLVRPDRELLHRRAAERPLRRDHLGGAELRHLGVAVPCPPAGRAAERVGEAERLARRHGVRDRHRGHVLHPARDDDVGRACQHRLRREVHRLLRRAALPVHGGARHVVGQPGGEPRGAGDVAGLRPDGVDAAEDHVLDGGGIDARAGHQRGEHGRAQVGGMHPGETRRRAGLPGCGRLPRCRPPPDGDYQALARQTRLPRVGTPTTIPAALLHAAARFGDREALIDGGSRWTFADLTNAAMRSAGAMIAAGIEPGDRVAVWAPNGCLVRRGGPGRRDGRRRPRPAEHPLQGRRGRLDPAPEPSAAARHRQRLPRQ